MLNRSCSSVRAPIGVEVIAGRPRTSSRAIASSSAGGCRLDQTLTR
jgi:hypothetical protein